MAEKAVKTEKIEKAAASRAASFSPARTPGHPHSPRSPPSNGPSLRGSHRLQAGWGGRLKQASHHNSSPPQCPHTHTHTHQLFIHPTTASQPKSSLPNSSVISKGLVASYLQFDTDCYKVVIITELFYEGHKLL